MKNDRCLEETESSLFSCVETCQLPKRNVKSVNRNQQVKYKLIIYARENILQIQVQGKREKRRTYKTTVNGR